tara:strand:+ start:79145 stop:80866 length:1722 start_codon:yes stop_codon:yes gene_type:complete
VVIQKPFYLYLFLALFFFSCASGGKKERNQLRSLIKTSQFDEAIKVIENSKVYKEKDNKLLFLMEKGLLLHSAGKYYQSSKILEEARELGRKLYTTSISNKVQKMIANDNYDIYYGERYEISLIHFYQALNHLLIANQGFYEAHTVSEGKDGVRNIPKRVLTASEIRTRQMSARAEVLAWDSFLKDLKSSRSGASVFKNDLLAKVFGAYIHEMIGTPTDLQIALQLYKDCHTLLIRNYGAYKSFNTLYQKYNENYKKFPKLGERNVQAQFINETGYAKNLKNYLNERIVDLSLSIRPRSLNKIKKRYSISEDIIKSAKANRNANVTILFQNGVIPLKVAQKEYFGLGKAAKDNAAAQIGAAVLTVFAAKQLGLLPPPRSYRPAGAYLGLRVAEVAVTNAAISFELPKIQNHGVDSVNHVVVKNAEGKVVATRPLSLVAPLGDIAEQAVAENAASLYGRVGARLAVKHVAAIAAAYATYKLMSKNKNNAFFARQAAVFQYIATAKGIEASERADTRYWSTLPSDVWMGKLKLPEGKYQVFIKSHHSGAQKETHIGPLEVAKETKSTLVNFRSLN